MTVVVVGSPQAARNRRVEILSGMTAVEAVPDGAEAIERLRDAEVLVVDDEIPDYPPNELLTVARDRGHSFRAVLLAPEGRYDDHVAMGFDLYLQAPVTPDSLIDAVETALACRTYDRAIRTFYYTAATQESDEQISREQLRARRAAADAALDAIDAAAREAVLANHPSSLDIDA